MVAPAIGVQGVFHVYDKVRPETFLVSLNIADGWIFISSPSSSSSQFIAFIRWQFFDGVEMHFGVC